MWSRRRHSRQADSRNRRLQRLVHYRACLGRAQDLRPCDIGGSEPQRQAEARQTLAPLGLAPYVEFILADAATILPTVGEMDLVFIDSEKDDYVRFFDMLRISPGGLVVADNVISHSMGEYVNHVRARPGLRSLTLPIGKGIELTRFPAP
jgi:predicted O-methyltransferase YrrM